MFENFKEYENEYGIEAVVRYRTTDGKLFETTEKAKGHIAGQFYSYLDNVIKERLPESKNYVRSDVTRIILYLSSEYEHVTEIYNKLHQLLKI